MSQAALVKNTMDQMQKAKKLLSQASNYIEKVSIIANQQLSIPNVWAKALESKPIIIIQNQSVSFHKVDRLLIEAKECLDRIDLMIYRNEAVKQIEHRTK